MDNYVIGTDEFVKLSREYVDDVMGDSKIRTRKEHYYVFAISNFIATKEYFLKKKIEQRRAKIVFNETLYENILPMVVEFYKSIKDTNKGFKEPPIAKVKEKIDIISYRNSSDIEYYALYMFNEIRNALSHFGNYKIVKENGEQLVIINNIESNMVSIPIELFDFVAFYINSYDENMTSYEIQKIFDNYLIYKQFKDNRKYYRFESDSATNKIIKLLSKTEIRINKRANSIVASRSGSSSEDDSQAKLEEYVARVLQEFRHNCALSGKAKERLAIVVNMSDDDLFTLLMQNESLLQLLVQYNIKCRSNARITDYKIEECIKSIRKRLKLDRKSASLYSHSIILFSNREEPENTNKQTVISNMNKVIKEIINIDIDNSNMKTVLEQYKQLIENLLKELPNLIRIDEHEYRNAVFHNNIEFLDKENIIHFWNQKDNTDPNATHSFNLYIEPEIYNIELKNIENFSKDVGKIRFIELYSILSKYYDSEILNYMFGKLWNINQIDSGLFNNYMSIYDFIDGLKIMIKSLSSDGR